MVAAAVAAVPVAWGCSVAERWAKFLAHQLKAVYIGNWKKVGGGGGGRTNKHLISIHNFMKAT